MSLWMPLKKRKNIEQESFGICELSPEAVWRLYTLAEDLPAVTVARNPVPPGVYITGPDTTIFSREKLHNNREIPLPKLDFSTFPYLLFVVDNAVTIQVESVKEKGRVVFPFLSYFDRTKVSYSTFVSCGVFTSKNLTLSLSLQRKRFSYKFINHYS